MNPGLTDHQRWTHRPALAGHSRANPRHLEGWHLYWNFQFASTSINSGNCKGWIDAMQRNTNKSEPIWMNSGRKNRIASQYFVAQEVSTNQSDRWSHMVQKGKKNLADSKHKNQSRLSKDIQWTKSPSFFATLSSNCINVSNHFFNKGIKRFLSLLIMSMKGLQI